MDRIRRFRVMPVVNAHVALHVSQVEPERVLSALVFLTSEELKVGIWPEETDPIRRELEREFAGCVFGKSNIQESEASPPRPDVEHRAEGVSVQGCPSFRLEHLDRFELA